MLNKQNFLVGLDIGGSKIEGILWAREKVLRQAKIKTPRDKKRFLKAVFGLIGKLSEDSKAAGIGIAIAGALDAKTWRILNSPNMKFLNGVRLAKILQNKLKAPVKIDNDVNCFLRAEAKFGQVRGKKHVLALTIGTGVGGGVLVNDEVVTGFHGAAGELGHMIIAIENSPFAPSLAKEGVGGVQTLEDLVSSHGFLRLGVRHPLEAQVAAEKGEKKSKRIYDQVGKYLGIGLASLINIFDPEIIILGGGIAKAGDLLVKPAVHEMAKHAVIPKNKLPPVKVSKLKFAGALGAISLFLQS
ncbi:MAG: ROK family protein [Candidatus Doudnabacteria bacterium]|nr:ROK family protein [Candidatus Doudnabacteria bacterium]